MSKDKYCKQMTLASLKMINDQKKISFAADFQREFIWTKSQQRLLIDSLLIDFDIPKIYLRKIAKDGHEFEVVDGHQRLKSVFDFIDNKFELSGDTDPWESVSIANKEFKDLPTDVQTSLMSRGLDIVYLIDYSDDEIEDMFLRLQNGSPLNAAEKRRAIPGNMKKVVEELASHKIFSLVNFKNTRYGHEDAVAKILHIEIKGDIVDIKPSSIKKTYEENATIDPSNEDVKTVRKAFNFIEGAFKGKQNPKLKKYAILTLAHLTMELMRDYDITSHPDEFADAYLEFETARIKNSDLDESLQDPVLQNYTEAARNDSPEAMMFRRNILLNSILEKIPKLKLLDVTRTFSDEQRFILMHRDKGICQMCHTKVDEKNWHADHIIPHSKGGPTCIENGQVLCQPCNLKKSATIT